ncbi:MAG: BatA domain-containing protein, partial [Pedosphaera sp.]|nr:BatA domain-containing protein [Pedosphaera sp.]
MLFGIAAIAVPIIIHFLNRRKFKTITWAAMKFVKLSVDQNQRRMRLEDLILLLIRCALLALLAFALARPALKSSATDVLGQAKVTGVVVLDNSYSMDLRGRDGKTAFEQARAAAKATLDAMPSGSAVGVLLASDIVQGVIDEPTYDLNQAHEEIDLAKVSHHATDLFPAMDRAVEILKGRAALRKEIYVITDGQASGWQQNADIQKLIENNKGDIDVYVLRVGEQEPPRNLAITKMDISSGLTPANHPLRFEIEVANHDDDEATDVTVGLYVDGEMDPRDQVTIPAVPAGGTISVPLYTRLEKEGYHSIRAAFPDPAQYDALPADNQNLLVVRAVKEVRVLIVDGDREARDIRDHESFFLQVALSPVENHYVKVDVKSPEQYAQGGLKRYTAVVMANVPRFTPNKVAGLQTYLRNGGGLIFYPGDKIDADFYNRELFEKHGLLPSPWGDPTGDATQDEVFVEFQKRAYEHP